MRFCLNASPQYGLADSVDWELNILSVIEPHTWFARLTLKADI